MLRPTRTFASVVRELVSGLSDASVVVNRRSQHRERSVEVLRPVIDVSVDLGEFANESENASPFTLVAAIADARHRGDTGAETVAHIKLGGALLRERQYAEARQHLIMAMNLASEQHLSDTKLRAMTDIAVIDLATGNFRQASALFQEAVTLSRQVGNKRAEGTSLAGLGAVFSRVGETGKAIRFLSEAVSIAALLGDTRNQGVSLQNLGNCYVKLGKLALAKETFENRVALAESIEDWRGVASGLGNLAVVLFSMGDHFAAMDLFHRQLTLAEQIGDTGLREMALENLARATTQVKTKR